MSSPLLLVDNRERRVFEQHSSYWRNFPVRYENLWTGDYIIMTSANQAVAIIERKTLEDFAATIVNKKRYQSLNKMFEFSTKYSCKAIFLLEGILPSDPEFKIGGIPYKSMESCIIHMGIRHGISLIRTESPQDTAQAISLLLEEVPPEISPTIPVAPEDIHRGISFCPREASLTMLQAIKGIGEIKAIKTLQQCSIMDLLRGDHQSGKIPSELLRLSSSDFMKMVRALLTPLQLEKVLQKIPSPEKTVGDVVEQLLQNPKWSSTLNYRIC